MNIMSWKGSPDDLWLLANWRPKDLKALYCDKSHWGESALSWESIRQYRKGHRNELKEFIGMEKPTPYQNLRSERERVRQVRSSAPRVGGAALKLVNIQIPEEHLRYHELLQEALDHDGTVTKATFTAGEHSGYIKNADNEIEYTEPMQRHAIKFEVKFDSEPEWPPVNRVESVRLQKKEKARNPDELETAFIFSDIQIPFEDNEALQIALNVMRDVKPDRVVFIGDLLDLNAWSRFEQLPEWAVATQDAISRAHQLLANVRKALPSAQIQVIEANHEARMPKSLLNNAKAAYGLKRADQLEGWPVLSVPYLTAMDTLDVEWVPGYPANRVYLSPGLQVIHGTTTTKGAAARRTSAIEKVSTIFGHDHRLSMNAETVNSFSGGEQIRSYGAGCLCRIDGHVPSTKSGRDLDGAPVRNLENWTQGFVIASYVPSGGPFHVEQVAIDTLNNYQTMFRGKIYEPKT